MQDCVFGVDVSVGAGITVPGVELGSSAATKRGSSAAARAGRAGVVLASAAATQEQISRTEAQTSPPLTAPQLRVMQSKAAVRRIDDCEHMQVTLVLAQSTSDTADDMQETFKRRLARIG